jgi:hypothetical protein
LAWIVLIGAWRMDRLERPGRHPVHHAGLVPGLLGGVMLLLGLVLALRGWQRGPDGGIACAAAAGACPTLAGRRGCHRSLALCAGLCGGRWSGAALPFWLATALFVTASPGIRLRPDAANPPPWRGVLQGRGGSARSPAFVVTYVFQDDLPRAPALRNEPDVQRNLSFGDSIVRFARRESSVRPACSTLVGRDHGRPARPHGHHGAGADDHADAQAAARARRC